MIRRLFSGLCIMFLAACSASPGPGQLQPETPDPQTDSNLQDTVSPLEILGVAPELTNEIWLNTDHPLRLADLRGQVVLIDMWTFG